MRPKLIHISKVTNDSRGFTLIEVMIAVVILTVGVLAAASMQTAATTRNTSAGWLTEGMTEGQSQIELLAGLPYEDPNFPGLADDEWDDKDQDGTNKDANYDGVDDSGEDFCLDDDNNAITPPLGGCDDISDQPPITIGKYTICWNVATQVPVINNKTVRVIITWLEKGETKRAAVDYIKAQVI